MVKETFIITQEGLAKFLQGLIKRTDVIAPVKNEFEDVLFLPIDNVNQIYFNYENTLNSPKEYLFPDSECMFTFKAKASSSIRVPSLKEDFVLFGARACDTKAINLLDKFFSRTFEDNYYLQRRKCCTLVTLACPQCWKECFCTSVGGGPLMEEGFDIQLIPLGNRFYVQLGSEKGVSLLEGFNGLFKPTDEKDEKELLKFKKRLKSEKAKFDLDKVYKNLKGNNAVPSLWEDIASRCQSCGLCLFICPACSCFTVNDREKTSGLQGRTRQWDACYFKGFTRMAGNQNPIASPEEMVKRKYVHKLCQQIEEFGMPGCTGCGRCNTVCVGNVNWLENLEKIEKGRV